MQYISLEHISHSFGPRTILDDVSFLMRAGDRVGLVGANGSGKSTLLRILAGILTAESGRLDRAPGLTLGYLPQDVARDTIGTIGDVIDRATDGVITLERTLRQLEDALAETDGEAFEATLAEYGAATEDFERQDGYRRIHQVEAVLQGLSLSHLPRDRQLSSMSGGERTRVLLAGLLLQSPDVLLLDEPTNNLDFQSVGWLETFLASYPGAVVAASHDRVFLNSTVTRIVEVDEHAHGVTEYLGSYDAYREASHRRREQWERSYQGQQEEMNDLRLAMKTTARKVGNNGPRRDGDKLSYNGHGEYVQRAISGNVRAAERKLRRLESEAVGKPPRVLRINPDLDPAEVRSAEAIRMEQVSISRDGKPVLRDLSFSLGSRARVVIVGENGVGKSTLLEVIAGRLLPDSGSVRLAPPVRLGYLDQDASSLSARQTVIESYLDGRQGLRDQLINELFHFGLFRAEEIQTRVGSLSLGQRRRLQLARLIGLSANVLLLDEPTNHLSLDLVESLEQALTEFRGAILAASHDRWFINQFQGEVWELRDGQLWMQAAA